MRRILTVVLAACAVSLCARPAQAQTAQRISIQGSGLFTGLFGDAFDQIKDGVGGEVQLRFTPGAWSIGGGVQYTMHNMSDSVTAAFLKAKLLGFFIEPRYVIDAGSERFAPYLSARFAYSTMTLELSQQAKDFGIELGKPSGPTINGGGGVLIRLNGRANIDVGATYGYTKFKTVSATIPGEGTFDAKFGSGKNLVVRLGLAVGIGG
jgi:hypothetical protein